MGVIICSKHGQSGIALVCEHVAENLRGPIDCGVATVPIKFYVEKRERIAADLIHHYCVTCADKIGAVFGGHHVHEVEKWGIAEAIVLPQAVCGRCYQERTFD